MVEPSHHKVAMWPDWELRVEEIREYANHFKAEGYDETPRRLEYLAQGLAGRVPVAELEKSLEETMYTFRSEFGSGGPSYFEVLRFIEPIVNFHLSRPPDKQRKFVPLLEELRRNAQNLKPIDEAFKKFSGGTRFYGKCFLYMINAEGVFDEAITLLYGLLLEHAERPVTVEELHEMYLKDIKIEPLRAKAPAALFEGLSRVVRNAIAHCRFYFEQNTKQMIFLDKNFRTGKERPLSYSADEFDELYTKLDNVWHAISHLICLRRVLDLVLRPDVEGVGKMSPIGGPLP
jgi:hypothetical protein